MATIKSGLAVDPDNGQLHKQLRIVKAKKNPTKVGVHSASAPMAAGPCPAVSPAHRLIPPPTRS